MTMFSKLTGYSTLCLIIFGFLGFIPSMARADCLIEVSDGVAENFNEIIEILEDLRKNLLAKRIRYNILKNRIKKPTSLRRHLKKVTNNRCKIFIATSYELERLNKRDLSQYIIHRGMVLKTEFLLYGSKPITMVRFKKPIFAHPYDVSMINIWEDIFRKCLYKRAHEDIRPSDRLYMPEHWTYDKLKGLDIIILKYWTNIQRRDSGSINALLLENIRDHTGPLIYPINFCSKKEWGRRIKKLLMNRFKTIFSRGDPIQAKYDIKSDIKSTTFSYFAKVIGKDATPEYWVECYKSPPNQIIIKDEHVIILYTKDHKDEFNILLKQIHKRLKEIAASELKKLEEDKYMKYIVYSKNLTNYINAYRLLTPENMGIIECANIDYNRAGALYARLEQVGISSFEETLDREIPLNEQDVIPLIETIIQLLERYTDSLANLPVEHIDENRLLAHQLLSQLQNILYRHNHIRSVRNQSLRRQELEYLSRARKNLDIFLSLEKKLKKSDGIKPIEFLRKEREDSVVEGHTK